MRQNDRVLLKEVTAFLGCPFQEFEFTAFAVNFFPPHTWYIIVTALPILTNLHMCIKLTLLGVICIV